RLAGVGLKGWRDEDGDGERPVLAELLLHLARRRQTEVRVARLSFRGDEPPRGGVVRQVDRIAGAVGARVRVVRLARGPGAHEILQHRRVPAPGWKRANAGVAPVVSLGAGEDLLLGGVDRFVVADRVARL